jgi:hypothetical protein
MRSRRWEFIPLLAAAGFLGGGTYPMLETWLNYAGSTRVHYLGVVKLTDWMQIDLMFGAWGAICCGGVGASLVLMEGAFARLVLTLPVSFFGLLGCRLACRALSWEAFAGGIGVAIILAGSPGTVLTLGHSALLALHDDRRLGLNGALGALTVGGVGGLAIAFVLGDVIFRAAIASGVFVCLTQYYAFLAALSLYQRRMRAPRTAP